MDAILWTARLQGYAARCESTPPDAVVWRGAPDAVTCWSLCIEPEHIGHGVETGLLQKYVDLKSASRVCIVFWLDWGSVSYYSMPGMRYVHLATMPGISIREPS